MWLWIIPFVEPITPDKKRKLSYIWSAHNWAQTLVITSACVWLHRCAEPTHEAHLLLLWVESWGLLFLLRSSIAWWSHLVHRALPCFQNLLIPYKRGRVFWISGTRVQAPINRRLFGPRSHLWICCSSIVGLMHAPTRTPKSDPSFGHGTCRAVPGRRFNLGSSLATNQRIIKVATFFSAEIT